MQDPAPPASQVIAFSGLLVIVGGGAVDGELLSELYLKGGHLVGADAGADVIAAAGLMPEVIVGDFDSLAAPMSWLGRTRLMQIAEQDSTDFEKALYSTSAPVTVAMGMTGRRFDHTLAALDALAPRADKRPIILVDEEDIAVALTGKFSFTVLPGERVSVVPLVPLRFRHSEGLKYPLDGLKLAMGERIGTSNSATDGPFTIEPESRTKAPWLLVVAKEHLFRMIDTLLEQAG